MKKIFIGCFILLLHFSYGQQKILFAEKNYDAVLKESKLQNKPIVVMFFATWCEHCKKMKESVLIDSDVINSYSSNYICIGIDAESTNGISLKNKLQDKFKIKAFPTFVFLDSNENLLSCISGEFKKEDFINEGKNALIPENQFNVVKKLFNENPSNPDYCLKFITIARKAGFDATPITQKYLKTKTQEELFSELNWRIIANGINDISADEINYIVANKEAFAKVSSPVRVEKKLVFIAADNLKPLAEVGDTLNYYKKKPIAESFKIRKVDSLLFRYDLLISERTVNWKNYQKTTELNVDKFASKDSNTLVEICSNYLEYITDKKGIENAINWTKQAINIGETTEKYSLISKLYSKLKQYDNALQYAEKGKALATGFGWKTDEIDKLISEIKKH
ncbi:thioredoxin fold domain-containing protein [Flavobacterium sp. SUN052]|uniref:thioredoxin family protein n=1 Tax=Flavobacterium sp. SUN052 TaxID=3002441 RepID=UPI00237EBD24|nr:thioredoxin fold domain-containing protein [Flavobacterium sp. SUN052]MEC4005140.1 thioredoxin fold domain-containing protein [Flavobacterium sp. SUN052]